MKTTKTKHTNNNVPPCKGHAHERVRAETNTLPMGNDRVVHRTVGHQFMRTVTAGMCH